MFDIMRNKVKSFNEFINENVERTLTLYHGTCECNVKNLLENGWTPRSSDSYGGNMGNPSYLYVSTEPEDALWFAEEKGCSTVMEISNVPISLLRPDPEDEAGFTMKDLLDRLDNNRYRSPAKFIISRPLDNTYFKLYNI